MIQLPPTALRTRMVETVLGSDPVQRLRVAQAGLATLLMALSAMLLLAAARGGDAPMGAVLIWAALSLGGLLASFVAIRSGWSLRLRDPSLTLPQMLFAIASASAAYAMAGPMRGAAFPVLLVILTFGMFQLRPRALAYVGLYSLVLFGTAMTVMAWHRPQVYAPSVEWIHFLMLATMLPSIAVLAARLSRMRERSRDQRDELASALARIQELATRDDLTGLINRRHMGELLEQERQRSARSGRGFCIAVIDIDHFKQVNDRLGHAGGDAVLRAFAQQALGAIRSGDVLARWGGEEFVLLLSDSHLPPALGGIERLRQRIEAAILVDSDPALHVTVSAGLTDHIAGEAISDALARADRALYAAKAAGRNRTVVADGGICGA